MATITETLSAHPSSYDTSHYSWASTNTSYPISEGYTDSTSTTYARINLKTGSQSESYIYYKFDFSDIPNDATIKTVNATAKANVSTTNTTRVATKNMQLATGFSSNITMKGSATSMPSTAASTTISSVGSWTVSEVKDAGIRFYAQRGTRSTSSTYYFRIYGATMTVTYEYDDGGGGGPTLYVKESGTWNTYSHVYKKVNGIWVEQDASTWSTLFDTSTNYVKG